MAQTDRSPVWETERRALPANLTECLEATNPHLQQFMRFGFFREGPLKQWRKRGPVPDRVPQHYFVITEEAGSQPPIRGETHPITTFAVGVCHGCDYPD